MKRLNDYLPFILQSNNIARIEDDTVLIGDRREYPFKKSLYPCKSVEDVAKAIETMVTQGGGPVHAAMTALLFLCKNLEQTKSADPAEAIGRAKRRLQATRPTNTTMARVLDVMSEELSEALANSQSISQRAETFIQNYLDLEEQRAFAMAEIGASLIHDGDGVLTMCFAETAFILSVALAMEQGKRIRVYTPETRPYLQGARLTAPCLEEIGADVQLICDNMPAFLMSQGKIQIYMTAVDIAVRDGWIANKVGTYQNAITASYHGIPYFPFSGDPDLSRCGRDSIEIEERDPEEVKQLRGIPISSSTIQAYYPAFDIVPPHLIAGIITPRGLLSPYHLETVYSEGDTRI